MFLFSSCGTKLILPVWTPRLNGKAHYMCVMLGIGHSLVCARWALHHEFHPNPSSPRRSTHWWQMYRAGMKKAGGLTRQSCLQACLCFCRFFDVFFLEPASLSSFTQPLGSVPRLYWACVIQATPICLCVCLPDWLTDWPWRAQSPPCDQSLILPDSGVTLEMPTSERSSWLLVLTHSVNVAMVRFPLPEEAVTLACSASVPTRSST